MLADRDAGRVTPPSAAVSLNLSLNLFSLGGMNPVNCAAISGRPVDAVDTSD